METGQQMSKADFCKLVLSKLQFTNEERKMMVQKATGINGVEVPKDLKCLICNQMVYDPVLCQKCGNAIYCKSCIANKEITCHCGEKIETSSGKIMKKNKIFYREVLCGEPICKKNVKIMTYYELIRHDECCQKKVNCPMGCGTIILS